MTNPDKKELRRISNELRPQFNLGKEGVTPNFVEQIDSYLRVKQIVKIKDLSSASKNDTAAKADNLAKQVDAEVLDKKGFTFVLYRFD